MDLIAMATGVGACLRTCVGLQWSLTAKAWKIMRLTAVFLLATTLHVCATGNSQSITLSKKAASLESIFKAIEQQTDYEFFYRLALIPPGARVDVDVSNATIEETLAKVLMNLPLKYEIIKKTVVIKEKANTTGNLQSADISLPPPAIDLRGRVVNENGEPVEGVTVKVKGSDKSTVTGANGEFILTKISEGAVLQFSHISMQYLEVKVNGETNLLISLKAKVSALEDVTVTVNTGYQDIPKERATGSFSQPVKQLYNSRISTDIISRLEGISNGLVFNPPGVTGNPTPKLSIRGRSTIYANDNPLIIVDGFPYDGDINNINPNDIDNITILKDAAAASIWGVLSGNGVIVITTKKGKLNEQLKVQVNSNVTVGEKPDLFYARNYLSSGDFMEVEKFLFDKGFYDAALTDVSQPPLSPVVQLLDQVRQGTLSLAEANQQIDAFSKRDVRNDLSKYFYRKSVNQQYSVSISGGSNKVAHYLSAGFDRNKTSLTGEDFNRFTLVSMNTFRPVKNLEITGGINYIQSRGQKDNTLAQVFTGGAFSKIYPYAELADDNGRPVTFVKDYSTSYVEQALSKGFLDGKFYPLQELRDGYNTNRVRASDIRLNTQIKYTFIKGLSGEIRYQYQRAHTFSKNHATVQSYFVRNMINRYAVINPDSSFAGYRIPYGGILNNSTDDLVSNHLRGQLNYNNSWGKHAITAIAGAEMTEVKVDNSGYTLYGYDEELGTSLPVDYTTSFPLNPTGTALIPYANGAGGLNDRSRSYYFNGAYTYDDRYTLSLSGRIDGSNFFGVKANQKNVPLWSAGVKWNIDQENFYRSGVLPVLRLRTTYGYNGNLDKSITAISTIYYPGYTGPLTNALFARVGNIGNPDLRWEKIGLFNAGIDFGTAGNKISGSIEYFHKNGVDMIGFSPFAPSTGIINLKGNYASIKGDGLDIQITSKNIDKAFKWSTTLIFNWARDIVTQYTGTDIVPSSLAGTGQVISPVEGKPVFAMYSFQWAGLDPLTGDPQGFDDSKNISKNYSSLVKPTDVSSLVYHGPARPSVFGGLTNILSYKNFNLSFNISYKLGYYFNRGSIDYTQLFNYWNAHEDFALRWQKAGDERSTSVPSMVYPSNPNRDRFYQYSEVLIEKGAHIRLRDIIFSYDLPNSLNQRLHTDNVQIYLYANNLGLLWRANDKGIDPDYPTTGFPTPRSFAFGIRAGF